MNGLLKIASKKKLRNWFAKRCQTFWQATGQIKFANEQLTHTRSARSRKEGLSQRLQHQTGLIPLNPRLSSLGSLFWILMNAASRNFRT